MEDENLFDSYAVAIKKGSDVIGHIPRKISAACFLFLEMSGSLTCEITDSHHQYSFDIPQGGMQIPCKLIFKSRDSLLMTKIRRLVLTVPPIELERKQTASLKRKLDSELPPKPPAKKKAIINQAESSIIDLDSEKVAGPSDRNIAKENPWVNLGRTTLTTVDRSVILNGMLPIKFILCVYVSVCRCATNRQAYELCSEIGEQQI